MWLADISDRQDTSQLVERISSELAGVHYLINSAGVFLPKTFLDHSEADYDRYLNINHGTFFATQQVVRNMVRHGQGGAIVNCWLNVGTSGYSSYPFLCLLNGESWLALSHAAFSDGTCSVPNSL